VECSPAYLQKKKIFGCSRARAPISAWGKRGRPLLLTRSCQRTCDNPQPAMEHEQMPPFQNLTYDFHLVSSAGFSRQLATRPTQGLGSRSGLQAPPKQRTVEVWRFRSLATPSLLQLLMPIGYRVRPFHHCAFCQPCPNKLEHAPNAVTPSVMPCKLWLRPSKNQPSDGMLRPPRMLTQHVRVRLLDRATKTHRDAFLELSGRPANQSTRPSDRKPRDVDKGFGCESWICRRPPQSSSPVLYLLLLNF
jgi:hypothetical protein